MTETTAPRRMKQPVKDELRRRLALAEAQAAYWQGRWEDTIPARYTFAAGLLAGALIGGWLL